MTLLRISVSEKDVLFPHVLLSSITFLAILPKTCTSISLLVECDAKGICKVGGKSVEGGGGGNYCIN